jgi:hypothetical protein
VASISIAQEAQSSIEIQVNAAGETVEGTVTWNNGKPAANATVALGSTVFTPPKSISVQNSGYG